MDVGDRVLVRQVGLKGKHKLADRWKKIPYVVVPNAGIPVYKVKKESGDSIVKALHRNMLLPFSAISSLPDNFCQSNKSVETSKTRSHSKNAPQSRWQSIQIQSSLTPRSLTLNI